MIGRRCKAGDSLSRAALIARALTRRIPAGAAACAWRVQLRKVDRDTRSVELAVRPPGHAEGTLKRGRHSHRLKTSAAHRSAAMAGGARPDPFRTRKLSRRAPMVLRGQPVGEQGAADRWTALDPYIAGSGAGAPRGRPLRGAPFLSLPVCVRRAPRGLNPGAWLLNFPHIVQPRAPGALFPCRGGPRPRALFGCGPPASPGAGRLFRARRFPCPAIKKGPVRAPLAALSTFR